MKIIIVGFGTSGKNYLELFKKLKLQHEISILDNNIIKNRKTINLDLYKNLHDVKKSKKI